MKKINIIKKSINKILLILSIVMLFSCKFLKKENNKTPIATIFQHTLYLEDINPKLYQGKEKQDSIRNIKQYVENWAYENLIIEEAKKNIDTFKINKLVTIYKNDLLKEIYLNQLINKYLDTFVSPDTLRVFYQKLGGLYKAKEKMLKAKYLIVNKENKNINKYKKWFFSDKSQAQDTLFKLTKEFKKIDLSAQKWLPMNEFLKNLPILKKYNKYQIIKKSKKFVLSDSLNLYLIFINDFINKNDVLPFDFVKNDVKQLVLSKRKSILVQKLKNDIKEEAIKTKKFKIYKLNN